MKINFEQGLKFGGAAPLPEKDLINPSPKVKESSDQPGDFGSSVSAAIDELEQTTRSADKAANDFVAGEIDLHQAMVQMEKADLMLKLGANVRNKVLDAYQRLLTSGTS